MAISPPRVFLSGAPRDPRPVWIALRTLCCGAIVLSVIGAASNLLEILAPSTLEMALTSPVFFSAYFYLGYANWLSVLVLFAAILWITYRLARNLHALAPATFSMSPTYAMAWYIVPIANLFMPPRVVGLIARETYATAGVAQSSGDLPRWWWATWVVAALLSNGAAVLASRSGAFDLDAAFDGGAYEAALWFNVAAGLLSVIASLLTIRLFAPIVSAQSNLARNWTPPARGR
jgi:hypothetical protein